MNLSLESNEAALLRQILTTYVANLREEVYKTENYDWRQELKQDEETIKRLIVRLEQGEPASR